MITIVTLFCSIYLFLFSFSCNTKNFRSTIYFKFIPFLIALWLLGISLSLWEVINTSITPEKEVKDQIEQQ